VPVERNWTVPEQEGPQITQTPDGDLLIQPRVIADGDGDALVEAVFEVVAILRRVGGTVQIGAQRGEVAPNLVVTQSYIFAYNSFTPLVQRLEQQQFEEGHADDVGDDEPLTPGEIEQHFPPAETAAASDDEIRQEVGAVE
jgi:hypothetical protein